MTRHNMAAVIGAEKVYVRNMSQGMKVAYDNERKAVSPEEAVVIAYALDRKCFSADPEAPGMQQARKQLVEGAKSLSCGDFVVFKDDAFREVVQHKFAEASRLAAATGEYIVYDFGSDTFYKYNDEFVRVFGEVDFDCEDPAYATAVWKPDAASMVVPDKTWEAEDEDEPAPVPVP